jgi:hypothetical protein
MALSSQEGNLDMDGGRRSFERSPQRDGGDKPVNSPSSSPSRFDIHKHLLLSGKQIDSEAGTSGSKSDAGPSEGMKEINLEGKILEKGDEDLKSFKNGDYHTNDDGRLNKEYNARKTLINLVRNKYKIENYK